MQRDMSDSQFRAALSRHGMKEIGFMGYVSLGDGLWNTSMLNAGTTNKRRILAHLLKEKEKAEAYRASKAA